ncbi:hypothetical protein PSACC_00110 [Paramicrosporidium saccamoebae]|uniref:Uncharacterized protein n=1 Tax=Paramicrosporidium saccamoebae TaxID=1246581 RepID=A0A2H9TQN5_9FUNG|nr:hypothetical protein PSACC_00110 [Paramicrosporidium saccamoebae]
MRSKLSTSLLLFSRSGLNRIGSNELISLSKSGSGEHLAPADKNLNVEGLCRELERKEKTIRDLRKQLGSLSTRSTGGQKGGPARCLSTLTRSASIVSSETWVNVLICSWSLDQAPQSSPVHGANVDLWTLLSTSQQTGQIRRSPIWTVLQKSVWRRQEYDSHDVRVEKIHLQRPDDCTNGRAATGAVRVASHRRRPSGQDGNM